MVYDYIRLRVSALFEIHIRQHGVGEREQKPARRHEYPLLCKGIVEHRDRADGKGHEQEEGIDADYRSELAELELEQLFADDNISHGDNDRDYYRQDSREHAPVAGEFINSAYVEHMAYHERYESGVEELLHILFIYPFQIEPYVARETEHKTEHDEPGIHLVTRVDRRRGERRKQEEEARYRL